MGSGKTTLLHRLFCQNEREPPMTVTSLVANAIYLPKNNTNHDGIVRIIDYPGHPSLASQFTQLLLPTTTSRVIFTIDTTQPVTEAVSLLYSSILINSPVRKSWRDQQLDILVTCTKTDLKGSKNYKRIKIQLRNELERLRKVDSVVSHPNGEDWTLNGKNIDLDNLGEDVPIRLYFVEVGLRSEEDSGMAIVRDFVLNGLVPSK
jgi:signal recognition particle receptor subunit beta